MGHPNYAQWALSYEHMAHSLENVNNFLDEILLRENRMDLYKKTISFIETRVDLDLASFKEDIWSH